MSIASNSEPKSKPAALGLSSTPLGTAPSPSPSPLPTPLPPSLSKPVRKLSNAAISAISAGESAFHAIRTRSLDSQVGGHPGVLQSEDNLLIVKSCLPEERAFYELLAVEDERIGKLVEWVPSFYGTLRLEGKVKTGDPSIAAIEQGGIEPIPEVEGVQNDKSVLIIFVPPPAQSIVLENVASLFTKPNIMDVKLGTVLHDETATPEKAERMLETARNTTSLETGIRLTGFQVYDHTTDQQIITPKAYGKSIKASDLPDGIRRFLPLSDGATPSGQGLPKPILLPIVHGLLNDIRAVRDALAGTELRMVGGSLLIVYEADWDAARTALDTSNASSGKASNEGELTNSAGVESTKEDEDEIGYDSDVESEEEEVAPAYTVRLIDFAHTRLAPGEGPDEGVLKGLDTVIRLFEGRLSELN